LSGNARAVIGLVALLCAREAWAADAGRRAFSFLREGESVRQSAMAGAGVADAEQPGQTHLNPAVLSHVQTQEVHFTHHRLLQDARAGGAVYARPVGHWGLAGRFQFTDHGDIDQLDAQGHPAGSTGASDETFSLTAAPLGGPLRTGVALKYARQSLAGAKAAAPVADVGLILRVSESSSRPGFWGRQLDNLTFGAAVRNFGPPAKFDAAREKLPRAYAVGVAHRSFLDVVAASMDYEHAEARGGGIFHLGAEVRLSMDLALRAGYRSDQDIGPGLTGGLGFRWDRVSLDYAFQPFAELGSQHRVGLSFRFGETPLEAHYQAGLREMRRGNFADAVIHFDKALSINPREPRVLRRALEAAEALKKELGETDDLSP